MSNVLNYILLATSVILLLAFFTKVILYRNRRALERELSLRKEALNKEYEQKLKELEEKFLREKIEFYDNREALEEAFKQKRLEHDEEMVRKQEQVNAFIEEYKTSKLSEINLQIERFQEEIKGRMAVIEANAEAKLEEYQELIVFEESKIAQLRRNQESITDALRRKALEVDQYNITLSEADRMEVKDLQVIATKYSKIRPIILKAIYEIYYLPEVKKLLSRVVGNQKVSGIYRITSKLDGRIYIGKSVDIRTRWLTHFKRASGIESETTNLLYPAMRAQGLENFSFEIIEKVEDESKLSDREKYWQEFYSAKEHGFSVR